MNGARLKTVVILLLLTVDIVLGSVFVWRLAGASRAEARAAQEGAEALRRLGFEISAEMLSEKYPTLYTREKERSLDEDFAMAEALIGEFEPETQGGGIYTAENGSGRIRLSNAGFFEFTLYPPYAAGLSAESTPKEIAAILSRGADGIELSGGAQLIDGARVFGRDITVAENDGELVISGGLLPGETYISDGTHSRSLLAALLALAGERGGNGGSERVLSAELGYSAELLAENYTALRPVWRIVTDAGEYFVNAATLELTD